MAPNTATDTPAHDRRLDFRGFLAALLATAWHIAALPGLALKRRAAQAFVDDTMAASNVMGPVIAIGVGGILIVISLVIALTAFPVLTKQTAAISADTNSPTSVVAMVPLIPLSVIAGLVILAVVFIIAGANSIRHHVH